MFCNPLHVQAMVYSSNCNSKRQEQYTQQYSFIINLKFYKIILVYYKQVSSRALHGFPTSLRMLDKEAWMIIPVGKERINVTLKTFIYLCNFKIRYNCYIENIIIFNSDLGVYNYLDSSHVVYVIFILSLSMLVIPTLTG